MFTSNKLLLLKSIYGTGTNTGYLKNMTLKRVLKGSLVKDFKFYKSYNKNMIEGE